MKPRRRLGLWITRVRGPWLSLGVHVDLRGQVDVHVIWWIVSVRLAPYAPRLVYEVHS